MLISNECMNSRCREKSLGFLCVLDLAKAYDRVDWGFFLVLIMHDGLRLKMGRMDLGVCVSAFF